MQDLQPETTIATPVTPAPAPMTSAPAQATPSTAAPEQLCSYPGKKCASERARKPNGTLHKLCELHRRRANLNQKRLQQKRRLLRDKLFKRAARSDDDHVDFVEASSSSNRVKTSARASSTSRSHRASSSPVSMDLEITSTPTSYAAQLAYLFADPLLQSDTTVLTSEDVFMLHDVLFDDAAPVYQTGEAVEINQQPTWFARV